jgi:hypothetical protein
MIKTGPPALNFHREPIKLGFSDAMRLGVFSNLIRNVGENCHKSSWIIRFLAASQCWFGGCETYDFMKFGSSPYWCESRPTER